jgi:magnesium transporter
MTSISVRWLEDGGVTAGTLDDLTAVHPDWAWIDILDPDEPTLNDLAQRFGLHPLAVEDVLSKTERPKVDAYPSGLFIIWQAPYEKREHRILSHEVDIFFGADHLITLHDDPIAAIDEVSSRAADIMSMGSDFVVHAIFDRMVDDVVVIVDEMSEELEEIMDVLLANPTADELEDIYEIRRRLVRLHRIVALERDIIRELSRERQLVDDEAYRYMQDVSDHLARVQDSIETVREVASAAMDIYLSSQSNKLNLVMKQLTVVATIFMPLTLISGIYGMNLLPGMWPRPLSPYSFWIVVGSMVTVTVAQRGTGQ